MADRNYYDGLKEVGVAANKPDASKPEPLLEHAGAYEYITLLNPLPFIFKGQVADSRQANAPVRIGAPNETSQPLSEVQATEVAGISLRNPDIQRERSFVHTAKTVTIEPGKSLNLLGSEAKVIIRQLVDEILGYRGQVLWRGSPVYRRKVEEEIVVGRRSLDTLANAPLSKEDWAQEEVAKTNEPAFPTLKEEPKKEKPAKE